jgi:acetyltransferase
MPSPLDCIFNPRGVAIIGASHDHTKRGYQAVRALKEWGYAGGIYPVNPKGGELLGLPVARSISEIHGNPDLALVCTPAQTIPAVLEECAGQGMRGAVVLAQGFGESGEAGRALEKKIAEVARRTGIRIVGPNTSGVLNLPLGLNLIGIRGIRAGRLALLVQSGNMALALMTEATTRSNQGFSICVGVGNETDIAYHEYLEHFQNDPHTAAILMYVEGFKEGGKFLEVARHVTTSKPVILLKGGRSDSGRASAQSHTGAMAGSYAILHAVLKQVGIIEVTRTDELFHVAETLACQPPITAELGLAVLSDGGGHATLAADALHDLGIPLARLSSATEQRLRHILGPTANVANPIDVGGPVDSDPSLFVPCLQALMDDQSVGGVLQIGLFGGYAIRFAERLAPIESTTAKQLVECATTANKPLVVHSLYAPLRSDPLKVLSRGGVPVVESVEVACRCIAASYERGQFLNKKPSRDLPSPKPPWSGVAAARREDRRLLLETEARQLVSHYGVPLVPATLCTSAEAMAQFFAKATGPVALKVVSAVIPHKTEAGGVILNIRDAEAATAAFHQIEESAIAYATSRGLAADFRGVLVAPMLPPPVAEIIVGINRDEQFGLVLTFGLGGVAVEVLRDVALRVLPIDREDAFEMLDEIRAAALLRGRRGHPAANREALVDLMLALADGAMANPEIAEVELNPVFAYPNQAVAVDARGILTTLFT